MVSGAEPTKGFMVAKGGKQSAIVDADEFYDPVKGPKAMSSFLKSNRELSTGAYLGLWHNKGDGKVYLDVSENIMDQGAAVSAGRKRDQISIWDVANFKEIDTGGTGQVGKNASGGEVAGSVEDDGSGDRRLRADSVGDVRKQTVVVAFSPGLRPVLKDRSAAGRKAAYARWGNRGGGDGAAETALSRVGIGRTLDPALIAGGEDLDGHYGPDSLAKIVKEQGWNQPSPKVSEEEFAALAKDGRFTVVYRGGPGGLEQGMVDGTPYIGDGSYGPGTYVTKDIRRAAWFMPGKDMVTEDNAAIVPMLIPRQVTDSAPKGSKTIAYDPVRDHALQGADAINSANFRDDYVVYNTGAVIVGPPITGLTYSDFPFTGSMSDSAQARVDALTKAAEETQWWALVDGEAIPISIENGKIIIPIEKGSRSEAGRIAANARWGKRGSDSGAQDNASNASYDKLDAGERSKRLADFWEKKGKTAVTGGADNPKGKAEDDSLVEDLPDNWSKSSRSALPGHNQYEGPNSTAVFIEQGSMPASAVKQQLEQISHLQGIAKVQDLEVVYSDSTFKGELAGITDGYVRNKFSEATGYWEPVPTIHIRTKSATNPNKDASLMKEYKSGSDPRYTVTHEYGHVIDHRSIPKAKRDYDNAVGMLGGEGMSRYGMTGDLGPVSQGREAFAEAWTGWVGSGGKNTSPVVSYFADTYGWSGKGGSISAGIAKREEQYQTVVLGDSFSSGKADAIIEDANPVEKGSRTEAARYAANARWSQNRGLGINREDMPQIPKKNRDKFFSQLKAEGVKYQDETVDPRTLKQTQSGLNPKQTKPLLDAMRGGTFRGSTHTIITSKDGHILDGHHRWDAARKFAAEGGKADIKITRIDMPIRDLLDRAAKFNAEEGIEARTMETVSEYQKAVTVAFAPGLQPVLKGPRSQAARYAASVRWRDAKGTASAAASVLTAPRRSSVADELEERNEAFYRAVRFDDFSGYSIGSSKLARNIGKGIGTVERKLDQFRKRKGWKKETIISNDEARKLREDYERRYRS
jgi:hypothetical protein